MSGEGFLPLKFDSCLQWGGVASNHLLGCSKDKNKTADCDAWLANQYVCAIKAQTLLPELLFKRELA